MVSQFPPILASLKRHKLTGCVLIIQVALTFAVISNVQYIVSLQLNRISVQTGLVEDAITVVRVTDLSNAGNSIAKHERDLAVLSEIQGVESVAAVDSLPLNAFDINLISCTTAKALSRAGSEESYTGNHCASVSIFNGTRGALPTLGLKLVSGRNFSPDELAEPNPKQLLPDAHSAIVPAALAAKLFGSEAALGHSLFIGLPGRAEPLELRIVGVVEHLLRPQLRDEAESEDAVFISGIPGGATVSYVIKSDAGRRKFIGRAALESLLHDDPSRLIPPESVEEYSDLRRQYFQHDASLIKLLVAAAVSLSIVTFIGIAGLANFWVQRRRRSIGIRRAMGSTRGEILEYFLIENAVIVACGIVLGAVSAWVFNAQLLRRFEFSSLPSQYYFSTALILLILGQIAALGPAIHAAKVPPLAAIR